MRMLVTHLEKRFTDASTIAEMFRFVHTIKGTTGSLDTNASKIYPRRANLRCLPQDGTAETENPILGILSQGEVPNHPTP
jgi:chemotaxis protein histidine kinase CheA